MTDKNKCPKDADTTPKGEYCSSVEPILKYYCTRKKGHGGKHHAHTDAGLCCEVWK